MRTNCNAPYKCYCVASDIGSKVWNAYAIFHWFVISSITLWLDYMILLSLWLVVAILQPIYSDSSMSRGIILVIEICNYTHFNGPNSTTAIVCDYYFFTTYLIYLAMQFFFLFSTSSQSYSYFAILFHSFCSVSFATFKIIKRKTQSQSG